MALQFIEFIQLVRSHITKHITQTYRLRYDTIR